MTKATRIVLVGVGCMGEAMMKSLLKNPQFQITGIKRSLKSLERLREDYPSVCFQESIEGSIKEADVVVLCVKPQQFSCLSPTLKGSINPDSLVISIMAGMTIAKIQSALDHQNVVRAMPNLPGQIGLGYTGWCPIVSITPEQISLVEDVLGALGTQKCYEKESLIDTVTAVSGSGPAVISYLIQALVEGGVKNGLARADSREAVLLTMIGTAQYLLETGKHPAVVQDDTSSPGGTSCAITHRLDLGAVRATIVGAIGEGTARSRELSEG